MSLEKLREMAGELPTGPGVYLFKDAADQTLYVGKAKRIRDRVRSHLTGVPADDVKQQRMLEEAERVEVIVTESELEALTLENSLVKQSRPKYNVKLRDDKNYPYLRLTLEERFPRLQLVRGAKDDGNSYYGPYIPARTARLTQSLAYRQFGVRPCNFDIDGSWERPCLYYDIGECAGPCVAELCSEEEYADVVEEARLFLEGRVEELEEELEAKMRQAAEVREYERAAHYRDLRAAVEATAKEQKMASTGLEDRDLFALHREGERVALQVFLVRRGLVVERKQFFWDDVGSTGDAGLLSTFLQQYYHGEQMIPPEVCVPFEVADEDLLEAWLTQQRGRGVEILQPQRGHKRRLLELVEQNARLAFEARHGDGPEEEAARQLAEGLGLEAPPRVIECIDVSNTQGGEIVASLVRFVDGRTDKSGYKRFQVHDIPGPDDFASMAQVVQRHFRRVVEGDRQAPDLLVVDGGRGQLGMAWRELHELGLEGQALAALEKGEEKVYLPQRPAPVRLDDHPHALRLLQRVRDEAHRFAITYHRSLRRRRVIGSELEDIPGIGPTRRRRLLRELGSLEAIREADEERLAEVLGSSLARRVHRHFRDASG